MVVLLIQVKIILGSSILRNGLMRVARTLVTFQDALVMLMTMRVSSSGSSNGGTSSSSAGSKDGFERSTEVGVDKEASLSRHRQEFSDHF